jgi:hypothetical protein
MVTSWILPPYKLQKIAECDRSCKRGPGGGAKRGPPPPAATLGV